MQYIQYKQALISNGLTFKDLNKNGELDKYEDWRDDTEVRFKGLYDQMTIEERAGLFYQYMRKFLRCGLCQQ